MMKTLNKIIYLKNQKAEFPGTPHMQKEINDIVSLTPGVRSAHCTIHKTGIVLNVRHELPEGYEGELMRQIKQLLTRKLKPKYPELVDPESKSFWVLGSGDAEVMSKEYQVTINTNKHELAIGSLDRIADLIHYSGKRDGYIVTNVLLAASGVTFTFNRFTDGYTLEKIVRRLKGRCTNILRREGLLPKNKQAFEKFATAYITTKDGETYHREIK